MPCYQRRRGGFPAGVVLAFSALILALGACDFVLGEPSIEGTWSGTARIDDTPIHVEVALTQTNLFKGRIHTVSGSARCSFPTAGLTMAGTVEGYYHHPDLFLELTTPRFTPFAIIGTVGKDGDTITGRLERHESEVSITMYRE